MAIIHPKLTYEDLLHTPDDGKRYEIIDGELYVTPSPFTKHQRAVWNLCRFFMEAETAGYGQGYVAPFDVVFDRFNVVEPDLLFIATERLSILTEANVQGAPDIAVEVLSRGTRSRDVGVKLHLYARFGVRFYYVVDPDRETVQPYELADSASYRELPLLTSTEVLACPLLPGVSTPISGLFV